MLQPPRSVKLDLEGDTLVATGSAPIDWARETKRLAPLIPGIAHYRDEGLVTAPIPDLLERVNRTVVHFRSGSSTVEPSERAVLGAVSAALRELDQAASQSGQRVVLEILGSTDETGLVIRNIQLSKERAEAVRSVLEGQELGGVTTMTTDILRSSKIPGLQGESGARIAILRASLTAASRGNETTPP